MPPKLRQNISKMIKINAYKTVAEPVILCGLQVQLIKVPKKNHNKLLEITEVMVLRWMCGITGHDRL